VDTSLNTVKALLEDSSKLISVNISDEDGDITPLYDMSKINLNAGYWYDIVGAGTSGNEDKVASKNYYLQITNTSSKDIKLYNPLSYDEYKELTGIETVEEKPSNVNYYTIVDYAAFSTTPLVGQLTNVNQECPFTIFNHSTGFVQDSHQFLYFLKSDIVNNTKMLYKSIFDDSDSFGSYSVKYTANSCTHPSTDTSRKMSVMMDINGSTVSPKHQTLSFDKDGGAVNSGATLFNTCISQLKEGDTVTTVPFSNKNILSLRLSDYVQESYNLGGGHLYYYDIYNNSLDTSIYYYTEADILTNQYIQLPVGTLQNANEKYYYSADGVTFAIYTNQVVWATGLTDGKLYTYNSPYMKLLTGTAYSSTKSYYKSTNGLTYATYSYDGATWADDVTAGYIYVKTRGYVIPAPICFPSLRQEVFSNNKGLALTGDSSVIGAYLFPCVKAQSDIKLDANDTKTLAAGSTISIPIIFQWKCDGISLSTVTKSLAFTFKTTPLSSSRKTYQISITGHYKQNNFDISSIPTTDVTKNILQKYLTSTSNNISIG